MISILNIGNSNVRAFHHIFDDLNIPHQIIDAPNQLTNISHLILPGVGSFDDVMDRLDNIGFTDKLQALKNNSNIKILGICAGMQVLFSTSEEGKKLGLNWISGKVKKIANYSMSHKKIRIPHMGWNSIHAANETGLFSGIQAERFYFLHSYTCVPDQKKNIIATVQFGNELVAAVQSGNVFGVQFHPEKGHGQGKKLLLNFYGRGDG
jgi:imidazole glycerol-phosphate synthase subunit HisH